MTIRSLFIISISCLLVVITAIASVFVAFGTRETITTQVHEQKDNLRNEIHRLLSVTDDLMAKRVENSLSLLTERGQQLGSPTIKGLAEVANTNVPGLFLGDSLMNNRFDLVDGVTKVMGGTATLFVRDGQEFTRVTTNVKKGDGSRAIGTKLNMNGGAGKAIKRGEAFFGQVEILGNPYLTAYSPMFNPAQDIIGIWYVGYSADLKVLADAITSSRLLGKGFVGLVDDRGNLRTHSDNIGDAEIKRVLADTPDDWQIELSDFKPWGYRIVTGYSKSEVSEMVWSQTIQTVC